MALYVSDYGWSGPPGGSPADFDLDGQVDDHDDVLVVEDLDAILPECFSTRTSAVPAASTSPDPSSNLLFQHHVNCTARAVVVSLHWADNADNEEGFRVNWTIENHAADTIETTVNPSPPGERPETTSVTVTVVPCGVRTKHLLASGSVSAFNNAGSSTPTAASGTITIPSCASVYLPALSRR